ncbi:DMT family transporter [Nocardioides antri]|uniref:Multidrug efflux SMR transporter n=1 Tax=Nocardioides antri TaxID=2607659 RepID=A0A5B1LYY6_9ACTN|nr:multidrug efflux SMR transporter [Nocardioides antri]KAA1425791.1 multidrug efflux SMR transporter [Nocardioides antri]
MVGPWVWLLAAGLVEVAWTQSIKPTEGFTRPVPTLVCFLLGVSSVYLLTRAMDGLPVGTAYCVFTGIGALGAVALGVLWSGDRVSALRMAGLALLVAGLLVVRLDEQ